MQQEKMQVKRIEKYLDNYKRQIVEEAKNLIDKPMPQLSEELFCQFEQTGNRLGYENVYFERRRFLSVFAITLEDVVPETETLDGNRISSKLEEVLLDICKEKCWALPAHVDRRCEGWENTIDLFSAETAFYLAEISQKLRHKLSEKTVSLVRDEVLNRVLIPFSASPKPYASWEQCEMNWNAVCNGAIGCAALWLMEDFDLQKTIERVVENLPHYLKGFSEDGVCLEGLSYYTYGLTFYFVFADLLKRFTGEDRGLLKEPALNEIAIFLQKCYLPGGYTISFSDGNIREKYRMGLSAFMMMHFSGVEFPEIGLAAGPFDDACYRYATMSRDIEWTKWYLDMKMKASEPESASESKFEVTMDYFSDAQWAVIRTGNSAIAVKGGHNDEPHNHNDVGSFIYITDGNLIITDIGAGEYTGEYFGEGRYNNICCSSFGHSVPIINNLGQKAGAKYKASSFDKKETYIEQNISEAYELEEGERIQRSTMICLEEGAFLLTDTFVLKEGHTVTENFMTPIRPIESETGFVLEADGKQYEVFCDAFTEKRILEYTYHNHAGEVEIVWAMQWDVTEELVKVKICCIK